MQRRLAIPAPSLTSRPAAGSLRDQFDQRRDADGQQQQPDRTLQPAGRRALRHPYAQRDAARHRRADGGREAEVDATTDGRHRHRAQRDGDAERLRQRDDEGGGQARVETEEERDRDKRSAGASQDGQEPHHEAEGHGDPLRQHERAGSRRGMRGGAAAALAGSVGCGGGELGVAPAGLIVSAAAAVVSPSAAAGPEDGADCMHAAEDRKQHDEAGDEGGRHQREEQAAGYRARYRGEPSRRRLDPRHYPAVSDERNDSGRKKRGDDGRARNADRDSHEEEERHEQHASDASGTDADARAEGGDKVQRKRLRRGRIAQPGYRH
mmetsp:Transcript_21300/g.69803  ORF Transcript_21300/g.69803 Transcript_21300/m.69803 type:complete len:323 (-) Transcript_21300:74-1042(-)